MLPAVRLARRRVRRGITEMVQTLLAEDHLPELTLVPALLHTLTQEVMGDVVLGYLNQQGVQVHYQDGRLHIGRLNGKTRYLVDRFYLDIVRALDRRIEAASGVVVSETPAPARESQPGEGVELRIRE